MVLALFLSACNKAPEAQQSDEELFVIGFSQLGSESDWRLANTRSMVETFTNENGYELIVQNAKQQQENQLSAVRSFILEGVDLIVIAPTVEEGWENVLKEIYNAFNKKVEKAKLEDPCRVFQLWPGFVMELIGQENRDLTMNDIWKAMEQIKDTNSEYKRVDSADFAKKVSKKIKGWYTNATFHDKAVRRIILQREEIYSLFEKVEKINVNKLLKYLDSSGFFYRPSSPNNHHNSSFL